jgi:hypothetical protein
MYRHVLNHGDSSSKEWKKQAKELADKALSESRIA